MRNSCTSTGETRRPRNQGTRHSSRNRWTGELQQVGSPLLRNNSYLSRAASTCDHVCKCITRSIIAINRIVFVRRLLLRPEIILVTTARLSTGSIRCTPFANCVQRGTTRLHSWTSCWFVLP